MWQIHQVCHGQQVAVLDTARMQTDQGWGLGNSLLGHGRGANSFVHASTLQHTMILNRYNHDSRCQRWDITGVCVETGVLARPFGIAGRLHGCHPCQYWDWVTLFVPLHGEVGAWILCGQTCCVVTWWCWSTEDMQRILFMPHMAAL